MLTKHHFVGTSCLVAALALACASAPSRAAARDGDGDGIPDHVEATLGTDSGHPDVLEIIYEDGTKGEGDRTVGKELVPHGDFTRISFCPVGRRRFVWKIDFSAPFPVPTPSYDVTILYLDVDNDPDTGRPDAGPGCDMMLRPGKGTRLIGWEGEARTAGCYDGTSLYLVADIALNQDGGQSVYRMMFLYQDTRKPHVQNRDNMAWMTVKASGAPDRRPPQVPDGHPLFQPEAAFSQVAVSVPFGLSPPQAELTFITSRPARTTIQYGATAAYGGEIREDRATCNHRVHLPDVAPGKAFYYRVVWKTLNGDLVTPDAQFAMPQKASNPQGRVARDTVVLTAHNRTPEPVRNCPFTIGVPFPQGALGSDHSTRLLDAVGAELPLQSQVTACWPDGTARWLLLDFASDVQAGGKVELTLEYGTEVGRGDASRFIALTEGTGKLSVDTGCLRAVFDRQGGGALSQVWFDVDGDGAYADDEAVVGDGSAPGPVLTGVDGKPHRAALAPPRIEVERAGPVTAVIKVTGTHAAADGAAMFEYVSRYHFSLGSALIRLRHTISNDQVSRELTTINHAGVQLPLRLEKTADITCELGSGKTATFGAAEGSLRISQELDNRWRLTSPASSVEAERGPGWFGVNGSRFGVWIGLRHFREMYPNELVFDHETQTAHVNVLPAFSPDLYRDLGDAVESDRLYYHLRDGGYRLHRGVSFTHELWIGVHRKGGDRPAQWVAQLEE
ncbi:MAG: hypothetical protein HON70_26630, partial [Lentisphaerae bacterium]|nr:hypothetical protein [Lentisphaerota bacterium]